MGTLWDRMIDAKIVLGAGSIEIGKVRSIRVEDYNSIIDDVTQNGFDFKLNDTC